MRKWNEFFEVTAVSVILQISSSSVTLTTYIFKSIFRRQSKWANSALVVNISPEEMIELGGEGPLRGVEWQQVMERRAAELTDSTLTVPVQRVTDFIEGKTSTVDTDGLFPSSSYRLGVQSAPLHEVTLEDSCSEAHFKKTDLFIYTYIPCTDCLYLHQCNHCS